VATWPFSKAFQTSKISKQIIAVNFGLRNNVHDYQLIILISSFKKNIARFTPYGSVIQPFSSHRTFETVLSSLQNLATQNSANLRILKEPNEE